MNRENLRTLANYLLSRELKADFDMLSYTQAGSDPNRTDCGTVGCAAGQGPYAGLPKKPGESWDDYAYRVFQPTDLEFRWCFSGYWTAYDNTPEGAARRILYLVEHGTPPARYFPGMELAFRTGCDLSNEPPAV